MSCLMWHDLKNRRESLLPLVTLEHSSDVVLVTKKDLGPHLKSGLMVSSCCLIRAGLDVESCFLYPTESSLMLPLVVASSSMVIMVFSPARGGALALRGKAGGAP